MTLSDPVDGEGMVTKTVVVAYPPSVRRRGAEIDELTSLAHGEDAIPSGIAELVACAVARCQDADEAQLMGSTHRFQ